MKVQDHPPIHLTYCLNVHPGQTWSECLATIDNYALKVRDKVAPDQPFALGLRVSNQASVELARPQRLREFRELLDTYNLYVFTINGFPYGQFHGTAVKEDVYRPDWQSPERRDYTIRLADILAELLSKGMPGSISTVPCTYKQWIQTDRQVETMIEMLAETAAHLARLRERTGKDICLALEPEPDCYLETTAEVIDFFAGPLARHGAQRLTGLGYSHSDAEHLLRRHIGVCFDTAHAAVAFEDPATSLAQLTRAGIRIGKVQLSSAIHLAPTPQSLEQIETFCDEIYLHQVKAIAADGRAVSHRDLSDAIQAAAADGGETQWRVHFHVPLYWDKAGPLKSTSKLLTGPFAEMLRAGAADGIEIETYTFDVLPDELRCADAAESIAREYRWVLRNVLGTSQTA